jgi:hypothetical protein
LFCFHDVVSGQGAWLEVEASQAQGLVQHVADQQASLHLLQQAALDDARSAAGRHADFVQLRAVQQATLAMAAEGSRARLGALHATDKVLALVAALLKAFAARSSWVQGVAEARLAHWGGVLASVEAEGLTDYLAAATAQLETAQAFQSRKKRSLDHFAVQLQQCAEVGAARWAIVCGCVFLPFHALTCFSRCVRLWCAR